MSKKNQNELSKQSMGMEILLSVVLGVLLLACFAGHFKVLTILTALAVILLLLISDLGRMGRWSVILLMGYVIFSGLTILWALAGKFYQREFSKIFLAAGIFLLIVLKGKRDKSFGYQVASVMAGISALLGILSVEVASTGLLRNALGSLLQLGADRIGFETGTRLTGILGNANVLASVLALGIFLSVALLCGVEGKRGKILYSIYLAVNSFTFLLCFSMGAIVCFVVSVLLYLFAAGSGRNAALVRMLEAAIPSAVFGFLAFPCFDQEGPVRALPLLLLVINAAAVFFLEIKLSGKVTAALETRPKAALGVIAGILVLGIVFVLAAYNLSGTYVFGSELRRSAYPEPGEHVLQIDAEGDVTVTIVSQDQAQTMMHTETKLYSGDAADAAFTVPEGSEACYFTFSAEPGTVLHSASVDGGETIRLDYTLLPGSIANRLQGLWANQNFVQRTVFFQDGMKLFRRSPIVGNGVGSFETGCTSVQDFYYETKYIHNHYIQVLLEDGVIGFVLYGAALISLAVVLVKKRGMREDESYRWIYPALVASFGMAVLHSAEEVSLSFIIFLCFTYAVFGLITLFFADPISLKSKVEEEVKSAKSKKKKAEETSSWETGVRVASVALVSVFTLTMVGNLLGNHVLRMQTTSLDGFLKNAESAVKVDLYERNDARLSYVHAVGEANALDYVDQANDHAAKLLQVQSNSIPRTLLAYYLQTGQYEQAIEAAIAGASYSSSDPDTWNISASMLRQALIDDPDSPLLTDAETLLPRLEEYVDMWEERNATAMETLKVDESSTEFFQIAEELIESDGSEKAIKKILNM